MKKSNLQAICLFILLAFAVQISAQEAKPQNLKNKVDIGINLPPLIGKTIDVKLELNNSPWFTYQLCAGAMYNNKLPGSYYKGYDGTSNYNNSGFFYSLGARFNTRKRMDKSAFFIGLKFIAGSFKQEAYLRELNEHYLTPAKHVQQEGVFAAVGLEGGLTLKLSKKFTLDLGMQYSPQIYTDEQLSPMYSVLPGVGAIGNLQGIVMLKYSILQRWQ